MRPIIAAAKLLLFCHLGKFFALFFHKTAEIVAFTPFGATISSPFQPIDTPSAAPVFGAEIMDGSLRRTDAERGIYINISTTFIAEDECSLLSHTQLHHLFNLTKYQQEGNTYLYYSKYLFILCKLATTCDVALRYPHRYRGTCCVYC